MRPASTATQLGMRDIDRWQKTGRDVSVRVPVVVAPRDVHNPVSGTVTADHFGRQSFTLYKQADEFVVDGHCHRRTLPVRTLAVQPGTDRIGAPVRHTRRSGVVALLATPDRARRTCPRATRPAYPIHRSG